MKGMKFSSVTDAVLCAFYNVYNRLGYGFLEKVYEQALAIELKDMGLAVKAQQSLNVTYKGQSVGEYFCDLVVNDQVIVEVKAAKELRAEHEAQLLNYLKASHLEVGLLLNFGPHPGVKRKIFDHRDKQRLMDAHFTEETVFCLNKNEDFA